MSEKNENEQALSEESLKWPIPFNVGADSLEKIVKAFRLAGADTKEVSPDDLAASTSLNKTTIKSNMKFLSALGMMRAGEDKTRYLFEEKGRAYSEALSTGDNKKASALLKELMTNSYLKDLIAYIELERPSGLTYEKLYNHIKGMARLKEDFEKYGATGIAGPYRTGVVALIDLLVRAEIIPEEVVAAKEESKVLAPARKPVGKTERSRERESSVSTKVNATVSPILGGMGNVPFTLNIAVEAKDPESIKQLINLIRELTGKSEQSTS